MNIKPASPSLLRKLFIEAVLPILGLQCLFFAIFGFVINAKFDLIDDHEILRFTADTAIHPIFGDVIDFVGPVPRDYILFERELSLGRFRPMYFFVRFAEIDLFGRDPHAWHMYKLLVGVWTVTLLYMAARLVKLPRWISVLMILFLTWQTTATEIWFKLGPAESLGMLFTAISMYAFVRASKKTSFSIFDCVALFVLLLAGWTKESFILIMPALVLLRLLLTIFWHPSYAPVALFFRLFLLWGVSALIFIVQLGFVFLQVRTDYAQIGADSYSPNNWFLLLGSLAGHHIVFVPAGIGLTLTGFGWYRNRRSRPKRLWLLAGVLVMLILWIIPQFILYSNGFYGSRYIYPVTIALVLLNTLPLVTASQVFPRLTLALVVPIVSLLGYGLLIDTHNMATRFTMNTYMLDDMVTFLAENSTSEDVIVIETNPVRRYERTISLAVFLGINGVKSPIVLHFSDGDGVGDPTGLSFDEILPNYQLSDTITIEQAKFIIPLLSEKTFLENPPIWFDETRYTRHEWIREQSLWTVFWLSQPIAKFSAVIYERND